VKKNVNQRSTVGWKATKTAKILVEPYMCRIEHKSGITAIGTGEETEDFAVEEN
jgi:hypothetical protein